MRQLLVFGMKFAAGFVAAVFICAHIPGTVEYETYPPRVEMNWAQDSLRSPGEVECRAQGRLPERDAWGSFLECMPERAQ
jgi:hypothetical protein